MQNRERYVTSGKSQRGCICHQHWSWAPEVNGFSITYKIGRTTLHGKHGTNPDASRELTSMTNAVTLL